MAIGAGNKQFCDDRGSVLQIIYQLVAARDVVQVDNGIFIEQDFLHIGKVGKLDDALLHTLKLGIQLGLDALGKAL